VVGGELAKSANAAETSGPGLQSAEKKLHSLPPAALHWNMIGRPLDNNRETTFLVPWAKQTMEIEPNKPLLPRYQLMIKILQLWPKRVPMQIIKQFPTEFRDYLETRKWNKKSGLKPGAKNCSMSYRSSKSGFLTSTGRSRSLSIVQPTHP